MIIIWQMGVMVFLISLVSGCLIGLFTGCTYNTKKGKGFSVKKVINKKIPVNEELLTIDQKQHANKKFSKSNDEKAKSE